MATTPMSCACLNAALQENAELALLKTNNTRLRARLGQPPCPAPAPSAAADPMPVPPSLVLAAGFRAPAPRPAPWRRSLCYGLCSPDATTCTQGGG